jgi:hypothetical protein
MDMIAQHLPQRLVQRWQAVWLRATAWRIAVRQRPRLLAHHQLPRSICPICRYWPWGFFALRHPEQPACGGLDGSSVAQLAAASA